MFCVQPLPHKQQTSFINGEYKLSTSQSWWGYKQNHIFVLDICQFVVEYVISCAKGGLL